MRRVRSPAFPVLIFLNDLNFQIVKIKNFDKIVLSESCSCMFLEIFYVGIQPYGFFQIKFMADIFQTSKHFFGTGSFCCITDYVTL